MILFFSNNIKSEFYKEKKKNKYIYFKKFKNFIINYLH